MRQRSGEPTRERGLARPAFWVVRLHRRKPRPAPVCDVPTIGWGVVHSAIDDPLRVSFALIKADECGQSCANFLREAQAHYASLGVRIDLVMTDRASPRRDPLTYGVGPLSNPFDFSAFVQMKGGE